MGICGLAVGHPADTIKVRKQTFHEMRSIQIAIQTFKYEGIHGFYKGLGFPLLTTGALNALFFGAYGNFIRVLEEFHKKYDPENKDDRKYRRSNIFLAGVCAGIVQVALATPVEIVKIQLQTQTGTWEKHNMKTYLGPVTVFKQIFRARGIRGLYHGSLVTIFRDSFSSGLYVLTYAEFLDILNGPQDILSVLFAGGMAGLISWGSIMPLDVIKSRIQSDDISNREYKGIVDCATKSYKRDGIGVFGRGFVICSLRSFPVNGAIFLGYEWALKKCQTTTTAFST
ncbi:solute carrier family 25 member 45 isoform X2 [Periplaneta americana]|uniref:solute carrier family 25 member 45 isoform X2 n=1 Tax=Periplaneta americana TaxID=6978 RepID=UPI0037E86A60